MNCLSHAMSECVNQQCGLLLTGMIAQRNVSFIWTGTSLTLPTHSTTIKKINEDCHYIPVICLWQTSEPNYVVRLQTLPVLHTANLCSSVSFLDPAGVPLIWRSVSYPLSLPPNTERLWMWQTWKCLACQRTSITFLTIPPNEWLSNWNELRNK